MMFRASCMLESDGTAWAARRPAQLRRDRGFVDYPTEVRNYGDHFRPVQPVAPDDAAFAGPEPRTHAEAMAAAADRAAALGIGPGARVLIDAARHADPVDWLLAPLAAGASVVLCADLDRAKLTGRAAAERVTLTLA